MNCQEFETIVVDLVRGEVADSVAGTRCWAHAANCSKCAERLLGQEKLTAGLEALANRAEPMVQPERIEVMLRKEFKHQLARKEEERARRPSMTIVPHRIAPGKVRWAWAIAAAVLMAPLLATLAARLRKKTSAPSTAQILHASPAAGLKEAVAPGKSNQLPVSRKHLQSPAAASRPVLKPTDRKSEKKNSQEPSRPNIRMDPTEELATNFFPLPYGSGLPLDEGWEIVRVNLPRSELASLGVTLTNEQISAETVKADIVLGEDGLARAIRFVQ